MREYVHYMDMKQMKKAVTPVVALAVLGGIGASDASAGAPQNSNTAQVKVAKYDQSHFIVQPINGAQLDVSGNSATASGNKVNVKLPTSVVDRTGKHVNIAYSKSSSGLVVGTLVNPNSFKTYGIFDCIAGTVGGIGAGGLTGLGIGSATATPIGAGTGTVIGGVSGGLTGAANNC